MKRYAQNPRMLSKTVHQNPCTLATWHVTYNAENKRAQSPSRRRGATAILRLVRGLTSSKARSGIPRHSGNSYRPVLFSNATTKVEMAYDYKGRRFEYKETVNATLTRHERYLYRGYLQIAALGMLASASVKHAIVWDPIEPVATRPLCLTQPTGDSQQPTVHYYSFDQVKNVTELFDSSGVLAATYDYSPFGQIAASSGNISNPITFSAEIIDEFIGLVYYNNRHYNPLHGRWTNRDVIEERGGVNLYVMSENATPTKYDFLGQKVTGFTVTNYNAIVSGGYDGEFFGTVTATYKCNCQPTGKYNLDIIKDTDFSGTINMKDGLANTKSGRLGITLLKHEETHADNLINYANKFDKELHAIAGGKGVTSECCAKKQEYLDAIKDYYNDEHHLENARLELSDYPDGPARDSWITLFGFYFCDMIDSQRKAEKAKKEMETTCAKK